MTFDEWFAATKRRGDVPYGTAYELFARKAWNAAMDAAAQAISDSAYHSPAPVLALKAEQR